MTTCILLNADYSVLGTISWQKAVRLIVKGKAEVVKASTRVIRNFERTVVITIPTILRLVNLIRSIFRAKVPFSKRNVLVRDNDMCAYCGTVGKHMTIDHVLPRSLGGKSNFENCVCACLPCNNRKDNRTCKDTGMYLRYCKPYSPTIMEFILQSVKNAGLDRILRDAGIM